jgi:release factor glutamine methyltransferase
MTASRTGPTLGDLVDHITNVLAGAGIDEARAEARDLVAAVAGEGRFWPSAQAAVPAALELSIFAQAAAGKRAMGMPFAYAVRRAAFRHLTLVVDERVLIPRQETEHLVDLVLERKSGGVAADVGTGSGAIALALASEGHFDRIIATDVALGSLAVARENLSAIAHGASRVEFRSGDLLLPLAGERLDVLVSNPPYIAYDEAHELPASVRDWEPSQALFSGSQGLTATRRIIEGAPALLCSGGLMALEVDCRRALQVTELVASSGAFRAIERHQDHAGRDRIVLATRA